jgi:hypothetical protein
MVVDPITAAAAAAAAMRKTMLTVSAVTAVTQFINQWMSRDQQDQNLYGDKARKLRQEASGMRVDEDQYRAIFQQRVQMGADPLKPGEWWDSRQPSGSRPLVIMDIGPRTAPAALDKPGTLDVPLEFLARSLKQAYASGPGPQPDVLHDRLCLDNDGVARAFYYKELQEELRGQPAVIVYGKSAGNNVFCDAVFSRSLCDTVAASPGELECQALGRFRRSLVADLAAELKLASLAKTLELFEVLCDVVVNTELISLLDIHFGLQDDAYAPRAHTFFFERRQGLIADGLWPGGNRDLQNAEQIMEGYPEQLNRLRLKTAEIRQIRAIRAEDQRWVSENFPTAGSFRSRDDASIYWRWDMIVRGQDLTVQYHHPAPHSTDARAGHIEIFRGDRSLLRAPVALDGDRHAAIVKSINRALKRP